VKIALVIERMDLHRGGRERSTAQVAETLARRGHEMTILCEQSSWQAPGVAVRQLGRRGASRLDQLKGFVAGVREQIAGGDHDIVHATLPIPGANVYQLRGGTVPAQREANLARRTGLSRRLAEWGGRFNALRKYRMQLEAEVMADPGVLCLAVSQMVAAEIERYYGRTENVRVVYNAVDAPDPESPQRAEWRAKLRGRLGLDEHAVAFLTVATNFELKGVAEAIEVFARWYRSAGRSAEARLVVVGRESPGSFAALAARHGVGDEVVFVAPTDDIFQWYAAADAVVLLSWYDPCSRVILEALCWHLPAITTTRNGAAERLGYGAGVVIESPRDVDAAAAAFDKLSDFEARTRMSACCRDVAADCGIDRHIDGLLDAYEDCLSASRTDPRPADEG